MAEATLPDQPLTADDIPWNTWSTPAVIASDEGFREIAIVVLARCQRQHKEIMRLRARVLSLQDELERYARHGVKASQRLYRRRPTAPPEKDPLIASRGLGLDV